MYILINSYNILKIHEETFIANIYTHKPFRMIGLIAVDIEYYYGIEKVTLAFYMSSGTNNGKIKGLWYPIVGIKTNDGSFTEFSNYINFILKNTTRSSYIKKGWLAKSIFFYDKNINTHKLNGFSYGRHYQSLLRVGETLQYLYEKDKFINMKDLDSKTLNKILMAKLIYDGNRYSQRQNFEVLIEDIFNNV